MSLFYFLAIPNALSSDLIILTEDLPPMNFDDGKGNPEGPAVDIVREIQEKVGTDEEIKIYPWKRAVRLAEKKKNVVVFSMEWTKNRDSKFKWIGPIAEKRDVLIAKKNPGYIIETWEDIKDKRIGTIHGDAKHKKLEMMGCKYLEPVSTEKQNINKLDKGRIDLWISKKHGFKTVCENCNIDYNDFEIHELPEDEKYDKRSFLFIAFSKDIEDEIFQKWKNAFNNINLRKLLPKHMIVPNINDFQEFKNKALKIGTVEKMNF